jgi:hypothetical protein
MGTTPFRSSSQRGAVLIHVAIALLGLVAFSAFVTDYGVMWVSRGQAQTSADAGALSGALALAYDNPTDFPNAKEKARAVALLNAVFGQPPDVQLADITFPTCPPGTPGPPDTCVKVDVFRNQARGNPLPMFFGHAVGVSQQGVVATATAAIITGTQTDCLKPWAILDRWDEFDPGGAEPDFPNPDPDFNYSSTFDKYSDGKGQAPPQEADHYVPPGGTNVNGTGFRLPNDQGRQFAVKVGDNSGSISSGWFRAIRIPRLDGQTGGSVYRDNIETCGGLPNGFATPTTVCPANITNQDAAYWATQGCYAVEPGNMVGPTGQGVTTLVAKDSGAVWSNGGITGSTYSPATSSPRVVPIGVLDIDSYLAPDPTGANGIVKLVNIYGFFIEGMGDVDANGNITLNPSSGKSVIGRIMTIPGLGAGASTLPTTSSFLIKVILVR